MSQESSAKLGAGKAEFAALMLELLARSATELFKGYGHTVILDEPGGSRRLQGMVLGAAIGYTGRLVRGALAIAVDEEMALQLDPPSRQVGRQHSVAKDWVGELANQLLGRIKNKLLAYNVEIALCTPVIVSGAQFRLPTIGLPGCRLRTEDPLGRMDRFAI